MPKNLLIVDDDQNLATVLTEYLSSRGFHIELAHTGQAGLVAQQSGKFDAIILDLMLPDIDGLDLCREIRTTSNTPIMMLTARGEEMDRIVGLELGADDYLPKPFNPRELLARLNAIFRRTGASPARRDQLLFGDLEIDPGSRVVSLNGNKCELTSYQFDLLWALAVHAGRVMSREDLMDALKGQDLDAFDRSIDVHISRIRSAIERDAKKPERILTVRGVGYVFSKLPVGDSQR